ncbi:hypothetical protein V5799_020385 [Amblyomma americanum]|uniref:Uncharacterized protein n=1 Tax=Amblyomma americanum TaxID=6943 RepID=A0AAQ4ETZ5_AMBAM
MFVGVVMMIGVLGMAGYIFYKGPDSKSHRLVASSETTEVSGERRQNEAEVEDPVPVPATTRKPKPKPPTNKRSKKKRSAPASAAKKKSKTTNKGAKAARKRHATTARAVEDAPQNAPEELDGDEAEEEAEQGANEGKCGRAALCECTKFYRKMNYVFDVRRQRCRLVALHECVEAEVGFPDEDSCKAACSNGER